MPAILLLALLIGLPQLADAQLCKEWSEPKEVGALAPKPIREASGIFISRKFSDRLYWINDSGDKAFFYITNLKGGDAKKIKIVNFQPRDTEALAHTECDGGTCLVIGDIGDNAKRRREIKLVFIKELEKFPAYVKPWRQLRVKYPNGAQNAEALTVLPNGDILIVTKAFSLLPPRGLNAGVYVLPKAKWNSEQDIYTLAKLGEIPLPEWFAKQGILSQVVTDMDISRSRQVMGLLTYQQVVEIPLAKLQDLANSSQWKPHQDYAVVPIRALAQQETYAYSNIDESILWSTEFVQSSAPIFSMTCSRFKP